MTSQRRTKRLILPLLVLLLVAAAAFLLGRLTSSGPNESLARTTVLATTTDWSPDAAQATQAATGAGEREILYWRAPMDPNEIYDQPGKSRMGMDLVPVYADELGMDGTVSIDPVTRQNIGVRSTEVAVEPLRRSVRTTGRFESDERTWTTVSLKVDGWVEKLFVDFEGVRVRRGQPLLELYSPSLVSTQEEYLLAYNHAARKQGDAARSDAQRLLDAARRRLAYWDIKEAQIERLEETGQPQKTLTLYAPVSGTVSRKNVTEGQRVRPGEPLMEIADLSRLWLMVDVYEQDLAWVDLGATAHVELPYDPADRLTGTVDYLYDTLNPRTRIVKARVTLPNSGRRLRPGMYAMVTLAARETAPVPVVPDEAVIRFGDDALVILELGQGRFHPQRVRTGSQADGKTQILEGLHGGERVVTSAQFLIDSEARLKSAVGALMTSPGGGGMVPETGMQSLPDPSGEESAALEAAPEPVHNH